MKKYLVAGLIMAVAAVVPEVQAKTAAEFEKEWESLGYGLYIHFGIGTFRDPGDKPTELIRASKFNPRKVDVKQWAEVAKATGAKYVLLTVKHEYGFCLWDSEDYEYDIGDSPARKLDILGDLIAACKPEGIKVGIHYSLPDFYNEEEFRKKGEIPEQLFEIIKQQTEELHKTYSEIAIQRFDWGNRLSNAQRRELHSLVEELNPDCIVSSTWAKKVGNEFQYPSPGLAEGSFIPKEKWATIPRTKTWMWEPEYKMAPAVNIYRQYKAAKKNGANFVVSVAPDRSGSIPQDQLRVLDEITNMIAENAAVPAPQKKVTASGASADRKYQEQLKKLKELYDSGLITKDIYDEKQKELIASLLEGVGGSVPPVQRSVDLKDGLVLHLSFNEESRTKTADESGMGNYGRVHGAKWVKAGRIGGAYRFDQEEETDGIMVRDSDSLDCKAVTVAAWIKTDDIGPGWARIVDKDWEFGYCLGMGGTMPDGAERWLGKSMFEFSKNRWVASNRQVTDGKWHHVVGTYGDGIARYYVDGKLDSEKKIQNSEPIMVNDIDLAVGNKNPDHEDDSQTNAFDGLIDEVRIYNRVLNPSEITALFKLNQ